MSIQDKIVEIMKNIVNKGTDFSIDLESRLVEDIGLDSLNKVLLIGDIEDEFQLEINDSMFSDISTVGEIVDEISKLYSLKDGVTYEK